MTQISQSGSLNTTAIVVPDLYVQIVSPQQLTLNGIASNVIGVVGTASWGPVNQPVVLGNLSDLNAYYGSPVVRKYDLGTQVSTAVAQGAAAFIGVRVTDGTDQSASYAMLYSGANTYPALLTAVYSGSLGNSVAINFGPGSKTKTWRLVLSVPGSIPEVFDNIDASAGNAPFWQNFVSAINNGTGPIRGASQLVVASLGSDPTIAPAKVAAQYLLNGSDGASGVTSESLVGLDSTTRSGMYALRGQGCSIGVLADCDDNTTWSLQAAFGLGEGVYMIVTGAAGETIADAVANKAASGTDSYAVKVMMGDWIAWYDATNAQTRLVSPQGFAAGKLASLSPEQSSLNKQLYGVAGSQKTGIAGTSQSSTYSSAELQTLFSAGVDVICNPAPGGSYWAVRSGHNSSSDATVYTDSYTRLTNYIAATLASGMGAYVGQLITSTLFANIRGTLLAFLGNLLSQGILGSTSGATPYAVKCDSGNNPQSRTALGYVQADVQVIYQGINEKFLINLQGGAGVTVTNSTT